MTIVRKTLDYNHGTPLPFEIIKQNREQATKEMAEGNMGLYRLLNTCIDMNLPTLSCCGDVSPMIAFECNDENKELLYSLWNYLESLYTIGAIKCSVKLTHSYLANRALTIHIRDMEESKRIFYLINKFIKEPKYLSNYMFYEQLDTIISALSAQYHFVILGDAHHNRDICKYILEMGNSKNIFKPAPKGLKTEANYLKRYRMERHYYGLNSNDEVTNLMYSLYDGLHRLTKDHPNLEKIVYKLEKNKN